MELIFGFLAGMFFSNGVPHFVSGTIGNTHMSPFAKNSSAITNVLWGFSNFVIGIFLFRMSGATLNDIIMLNTFSIIFLAGILCMGIATAWLFSNPNSSFPWFKK